MSELNNETEGVAVIPPTDVDFDANDKYVGAEGAISHDARVEMSNGVGNSSCGDDADDVIGEPESELESAVEEELPVGEEEGDTSGSSHKILIPGLGRGNTLPMVFPVVDGNDPQEEASGDTSSDSFSLEDMVDTIDNVSKSLEIQRQMFDAREQLSQVCFSLGIKKDDQDLLDVKFQKEYTKTKLERIINNKDEIDKEFFTREDGSVINITTVTGKNEQYEAKKELVEYLYSFYELERSVQKDLDAINEDIRNFNKGDVASASATVANNMKQGINDRWAEMEQKEDGPEKEKERRLLIRIRSGYTFEELLDTLDRYPSIPANAMRDMENPERVKDVGKRYAEKLRQGKTFSKLYGAVQDDISKSIEKQFLHEDDYVPGKENFFAFLLIRFFGTETWSGDGSDYIEKSHNATCIVMNNLMSGTLDTEFRDEVVDNIKKVWAKVKELI